MNSMNFTLGPFSAESFFNFKSGAGTLEFYPFIGHLTIYLLLKPIIFLLFLLKIFLCSEAVIS